MYIVQLYIYEQKQRNKYDMNMICTETWYIYNEQLFISALCQQQQTTARVSFLKPIRAFLDEAGLLNAYSFICKNTFWSFRQPKTIDGIVS